MKITFDDGSFIECRKQDDKIVIIIQAKDHLNSSAQIITGADMSCLMHMDGIINRDKTPIKVMHIVEILAGVRP